MQRVSDKPHRSHMDNGELWQRNEIALAWT